MSHSFATPWTVPARLLCPWDSLGSNTGVDCHFPLPGDLCDSGIKPHLLTQQVFSLPLTLQGSLALILDGGKLWVKKQQLLEEAIENYIIIRCKII